MKQLREDFFSDNNDNQMRRSELGDEFSAMKSRLMEEFMSTNPGYYARESSYLPGGDKPYCQQSSYENWVKRVTKGNLHFQGSDVL